MWCARAAKGRGRSKESGRILGPCSYTEKMMIAGRHEPYMCEVHEESYGRLASCMMCGSLWPSEGMIMIAAAYSLCIDCVVVVTYQSVFGGWSVSLENRNKRARL